MSERAWDRWRQRVRARPGMLLRRVGSRLGRPPYGRPAAAVVNGFPKAGTHLLVRCVTLLGGAPRADLFLDRKTGRELNLPPVPPGGDGILLGIGAPVATDRAGVERALAGLWAGEFAAGHIPYSAGFEELLRRHALKMLVILRDPRDVVVSLVHHLTSHPENPLHDYFNRVLRTPEARLLAAITGVEAGKTLHAEWGASIGERLRLVKPWLSVSEACVTRFERLVGPAGGGDDETQQSEIGRIARYLGLSLTSEQVRSVASRLFGQGSPTFRRGRIGSWRENFTAEHKAALKQVAGQELVDLGYERDLEW